MKNVCPLLDRPFARLKHGLLLCLVTGLLLPVGSQAATLLATFGGTVRKYSSTTGADFGLFAGGFTQASGIGWDAANQFVYVADYSANTVTKFTADGASLGTFGSGFNGPEDVIVDSLGNVYVSNYSGFTVTKFSSAGALLDTIDPDGRPEGLGFATNGDLLVNIYNGSSGGTIRRYDPSTGDFIETFASGLVNPLGMTTDGSGNVYVAEFPQQRISKFGADGSPLGSVDLGYLPYDLAINEQGQLLASNPNPGNTIERYEPNLSNIDTFATTSSGPLNMAIIVPEPSRVLLLGIGLVSLLLWRRR